jgi:hypothetical protein
MREIRVSAKKFLRLFDYIERVGLDMDQIIAAVNILPERVAQLGPEQGLPAQQYSRLYKAAVRQMETLGEPIPWAAGIGSEVFELMCHCIIGSRTLGDALEVATRYEKLLYPLLNYNIRLITGDRGRPVKLSYCIKLPGAESKLVPARWDRAGDQETVAKASGLMVWHALCGWLTGPPLQATEVRVDAPYLSESYYDGLTLAVQCPISFDAGENTISFSAERWLSTNWLTRIRKLRIWPSISGLPRPALLFALSRPGQDRPPRLTKTEYRYWASTECCWRRRAMLCSRHR